VATVLGLAFKVFDPDGLLGGEEELGITCALIPADMPGVEIGRRHFPLNAAFQNGPNSGKDVFIPMEFIIGGQENIGKGWRIAVSRCPRSGLRRAKPARAPPAPMPTYVSNSILLSASSRVSRNRWRASAGLPT
jgi:acyl-CoA dehydrogenase